MKKNTKAYLEVVEKYKRLKGKKIKILNDLKKLDQEIQKTKEKMAKAV